MIMYEHLAKPVWNRITRVHSRRKGKHHFMADLLFDWFGFSSFAYVELGSQVWLTPNRRSAAQ